MLQNIKTNLLINFISGYLRECKAYVFAFLIVASLMGLELTLTPYSIKLIVDTATNNPHQVMLACLAPALLYIAIAIITNLNLRFYEFLNSRFYPGLKAQIIKDLFMHLSNQPYSYFQSNLSASISRKVIEMAVNTEMLLASIFSWFAPRAIALIFATLCLFLCLNFVFSIILLVWSVIFITFTYFAARRASRLAADFAGLVAQTNGKVNDYVSNILTAQIFTTTSNNIKDLTNNLDDLQKRDKNLQTKLLHSNIIQSILVISLISSMTYTILYYYSQEIISVGDFVLVFTLTVTFINAVYNLGQEMLRFAKILGSCNQCLTLISESHALLNETTKLPDIDIKDGAIKFNMVSFAYNQQRVIFEDLNFEIKSKQKIGIIGASGSGKSTIAKLILRLFETNSGNISIDDQDISQYNINSLRKKITVIPQEIELLNTTIYENIRLSNSNASIEQIISAAKIAQCHEFILALNHGYDTVVGEKGLTLSGGQKQRIAIARAILKNAPIVLIDEATSELDHNNAGLIEEAFHKIFHDKTTIIIAHKLETLRHTDKIYILESGKILAAGTYKQLTKDTLKITNILSEDIL